MEKIKNTRRNPNKLRERDLRSIIN